jgi:hypothetical protein
VPVEALAKTGEGEQRGVLIPNHNKILEVFSPVKRALFMKIS